MMENGELLPLFSRSTAVSISITSALRLTRTKSSVESSEPQCERRGEMSLFLKPSHIHFDLSPRRSWRRKGRGKVRERGQFDLFCTEWGEEMTENQFSLREGSFLLVRIAHSDKNRRGDQFAVIVT